MQSSEARSDGQLLRGALDMVLLAALEGGPKYGLEIIQHVQQQTEGHFQFKEGTLYPALHRLQKRGAITASSRPSDTGGPPRKYYSLTLQGERLLSQQREEQRKHIRAVSVFLLPPAPLF